MAEVFRAKSFGVEGFEKTLVIKRILPELSRDKKFVDMFIREAKLAVRLSHANVVQVFDLGRVERGDSETTFYMAMEYVGGFDLATLLSRFRKTGHPSPTELCVYVAAEAAKGLDHAHRRRDEKLMSLGIVHRDVSPQNILLSWDGEVKITDFGIAKARHEVGDPSRALVGKYAYMSPEQALRGDVGPASDIFSLGTVLYEAIAGQNPFFSSDPEETLQRVRSAVVRPITDARPDVGPELAGLVARAMAVDPADRFTSVADMYEALLAQQYASGARFGAGDLSTFMERFRDVAAAADAEIDELLEQPTSVENVAPDTFVEDRDNPTSTVPSRREISVLVLALPAGAGEAAERRVEQLMARYGAHIASRQPTEVVGLFGLEEADGRDIENAVRCALEIVHATGDVQSGAAIVVGGLRVERDRALDLEQAGELTTAARQLASPGQVVVSARAGKAVRKKFTMEGAGESRLVTGVKEEDLGPFVGRRTELKALGDAVSEAARGKLVVLGLVGEHGTGKTRFVYEVRRRLDRGAGSVGFYVADCSPRGRELPFSGVVSMLRSLAGVRESDSTHRTSGVAHALRALGLVEDEVDIILAHLGVTPARTPQVTANSLRAAVGRVLRSLARDRPHLFVWDNAQELDAESATLLEAVAAQLQGSRAVLLFAARPRENAPYNKVPGYREIELGALSAEEVLRLVGLRVGAENVPHELVHFVLERAGGHPMFVEELLHDVVESGAVIVQGNSITALRLHDVHTVPRSLSALLGDRFQRLPEDQRNVLVSAAIIGSPMDTAVLASMLKLPIGAVNRAAEQLQKQKLLRRDGPVTLRFWSALFAEVIESELDAEGRKQLHQRAADAYRAVLGEDIDSQASRVARHLEEAGRTGEAATFYAKGGLEDFRARRLEQAAVALARAVDLVDFADHPAEETLEWITTLSLALRHLRSGEGLSDLVLRVVEKVRRSAAFDDVTRSRAYISMALMLGSLNHYDEAHLLLAKAVETSSSAELSLATCMAEGELALRQGDFRLAVQAFGKAEVPADDPADQHRRLVSIAHSFAGSGDHAQALAAIQQASLVAGAEDPVLACERTKVHALILAFRRDWAGCAEAAEQAAEQGRAAGIGHELAVNLHNRGESLLRMEDHARAYVAFQESLAASTQMGSDRLVNINRMFIAYLDGLKGSPSAAEALEERITLAEQRRWTWDALSGRFWLGRLLVHQGDRAGAKRELDRASAMAEASQNGMAIEDCRSELERLGV